MERRCRGGKLPAKTFGKRSCKDDPPTARSSDESFKRVAPEAPLMVEPVAKKPQRKDVPNDQKTAPIAARKTNGCDSVQLILERADKREVNIQHFSHLSGQNCKGPPNRNFILGNNQCFHWVEFLTYLTESFDKIKKLSLNSAFPLTDEQLQAILPFINQSLCRCVEHVTVEIHVRNQLFTAAGKEHNEEEIKEEDKGPHLMTSLCTRKRLPNLRSLRVQECRALNNASLKSITKQTLPFLHRLELCWGNGTKQYALQGEHEPWVALFMQLPPHLQHLTLALGRGCCFLQYLKARFSRGCPLAQLKSVQFELYPDVSDSDIEALNTIYRSLPFTLTQFQLNALTCPRPTDLLCLSRLTNMELLHLALEVSTCNYKQIGALVCALKKLVKFHFLLKTPIPWDNSVMESKAEDLYTSLSESTKLQELNLPTKSVTTLALDRLMLPDLRRLTFESQEFDTFGGLKPSPSLVPQLARVVGHCPSLEVLDLCHLWAPTQSLPDKVATLSLLTELERSVEESQAPEPLENKECLLRVDNPEYRPCRYSGPAAPRLCVKIGSNPQSTGFPTCQVHERQVKQRKLNIMDQVNSEMFKDSHFIRVEVEEEVEEEEEDEDSTSD